MDPQFDTIVPFAATYGVHLDTQKPVVACLCAYILGGDRAAEAYRDSVGDFSGDGNWIDNFIAATIGGNSLTHKTAIESVVWCILLREQLDERGDSHMVAEAVRLLHAISLL